MPSDQNYAFKTNVIFSSQIAQALSILNLNKNLVVYDDSYNGSTILLHNICGEYTDMSQFFCSYYLNMAQAHSLQDFIDMLTTALFQQKCKDDPDFSRFLELFDNKFRFQVYSDFLYYGPREMQIHVPLGNNPLRVIARYIQFWEELCENNKHNMLICLDRFEFFEPIVQTPKGIKFLVKHLFKLKKVSFVISTKSKYLYSHLELLLTPENWEFMKLFTQSIDPVMDLSLNLPVNTLQGNDTLSSGFATSKLLNKENHTPTAKSKGDKPTLSENEVSINPDECTTETPSKLKPNLTQGSRDEASINNADSPSETPTKRKPGRPQGSKNKKKETEGNANPSDTSTYNKPGKTEESEKEVSINPAECTTEIPSKLKPNLTQGSTDEASINNADSPSETPTKRKPGRPQGSKNKKKKETEGNANPSETSTYNKPGKPGAESASNYEASIDNADSPSETPTKRKRGRPKGSKNKKKETEDAQRVEELYLTAQLEKDNLLQDYVKDEEAQEAKPTE